MDKYQKISESLFTVKQIIFDSFANLFGHLSGRVYLISYFTLNVLLWIFAYYMRLQSTSNLINLHYNVDFGIDYIGEPKYLFMLPLYGLLIFLVNFLIIILIGKSKDFRFIHHLLLASAVFAQVLLLLSQATIYLINFY